MKKIRILQVMIFFILLFVPLWVEAETTDVVTMISTPAELDAVRNNLDGNYKLAGDIDMSKTYNFEPIGNETDGPFTGTFDGNGYAIKNLELNYDSFKYVGLFGYLDGTVSNLTLENADVTGGRYVGGIAGYVDENGGITGCKVSGNVKFRGTGYFTSYVGGIAGKTNCDLTNCKNIANISNENGQGNVSFGGIVSYTVADVNNCINSGNITGVGTRAGIVCSANSIRNCQNHGNIDTYWGCEGYGIGCAKEIILKCSNNGTIGSVNESYGWAYGIGKAKEISDSFNTGDLYAQYISAFGNATITRCYNTGFCSGDSGYSNNKESFSNGVHNYTLHTPYSISYGSLSIYYSHPSFYVDNYHIYPFYTASGNTLKEIVQQEKYNSLDYDNYWYRNEAYNDGLPIPKNIPTHLDLNHVLLILNPRDSAQLYGYINGEKVEDLEWSVYGNGADCIQVSQSGKITAINKNEYSLLVSAKTKDGYRMNCTVFVVDNAFAVARNDSSPLRIGTQEKLIAKNYYTTEAEQNATVSWSSSDDSIATVDGEGNVTATGIGTATITATTSTGKSASTEVQVNYGNELSLNTSELMIGRGKNGKIIPTVLPVDAKDTFSYTSSDTNVVTVDSSGTVTGKSAGTTTITVTTSGGLTATCRITVTDLSLTSSATVNINQTKELSAKATPAEIKHNLVWTSLDDSIVTVDENGVVTGIAPGITKVQVENEQGVTAVCTVTVTGYANDIMLDRTSINMEKGTTDKLLVALVPETASDTISYSSSNLNVVSVDTSGVLTANAVGTAQITVTSRGGITKYCSVVVSNKMIPATALSLNDVSVSMYPEETTVLAAEITPANATNSQITWESSNDLIAKVNQAGMITAVNPGTAVITASLANGLSQKCTVKVKRRISTKISITNVNAEPGETVEVPVKVENNVGIASMRLKVGYDPECVTPIGVEESNLLKGAQISGNMNQAGEYLVLCSKATNINEDGILFNVIFTVSNELSNGDVAEITLSYDEGDICSDDHEDLSVKVESGIITIKERLAGDVFEDEKLNSHDILLLQQYMTELVNFTRHQRKLGDLDDDGVVSMKDVVALAQLLVQPSVAQTFAEKEASLFSDDSAFEIRVGTASLEEDGTVLIPVTFENCPGMSAFKFSINYDTDAFELLEINNLSDIIKDSAMVNLEKEQPIITWYADSDKKLDGQIFVMKFKLKDVSLQDNNNISLTFDENNLCNDKKESLIPVITPGQILSSDSKVKSFEQKGLRYTVIESANGKQEVSVCQGTNGAIIGANGILTIPSVIEEEGIKYTVAMLEERAFAGNQQVKTIVIPKSITSIGKEVFSGCANLTNVTFESEKAPVMDADAFKETSSKLTVYLPVNSIGYEKLIALNGITIFKENENNNPLLPAPVVPELKSPTYVLPTPVKVTAINISGISKQIAEGKKIQLTATVLPANADIKNVSWTSSNTKVATVSASGMVTL